METLSTAWLCLNQKSLKYYFHGFQSLYNVITDYGNRKIALEIALRDGFDKFFNNQERKISFIFSLFRIKKACFRYTQDNGLMNLSKLDDTLKLFLVMVKYVGLKELISN